MINGSSKAVLGVLYDGQHCTICGDMFQVGDSICELQGTRVWSAFEVSFSGEMVVRYHACCMEEVLCH